MMFPIVQILSTKHQPLAELKLLNNKNHQMLFANADPKKELHMFHTAQEVFFENKEHGKMFLYHMVFEGLKAFDNSERVYYEFQVASRKEIFNNRRERRDPVYLEALYKESTSFNQATILDMSSHGMKIKTGQPIYDSFIDIYFDQYADQKFSYGRIVWSETQNGDYFYGLSLYNNEEVV